MNIKINLLDPKSDLRGINMSPPGSLAWYDERGIEPPIVPAPSRWRSQGALMMLSGALEHQSDVRPYDAYTVRFLMEAVHAFQTGRSVLLPTLTRETK